MKKPHTRVVMTENLSEMLRLFKPIKRNLGAVKFSSSTGGTNDEKILCLDNLFSKREIMLKCLKTEARAAQTYYFTVKNSFELGPLVQVFSWNPSWGANLYLGDLDFDSQKNQLNIFNTLEHNTDNFDFTVCENPKACNISLSIKFSYMTMGVIIDYVNDSNGTTPYKIFGMTVPNNADVFDVFYTTPKKGQECFDLANSLIEKYSFPKHIKH